MNIRNVLRTYSLLRQLSDDETALLNTLRQLNDAERDLLVESLSPEKPAAKKGGKKSAAKSSAKSARASGMAAAISNSLNAQRRVTMDDDDDPNEHCQKEFAGGFICNEAADANVHHLRGATGYHEFVAGKSSAPPAGERSSTSGGVTTTIQNSGMATEDASGAVHAGG